jgi:phosphopantothenoylcysteine decarboxylase / phosphopantothenate---cysteine ligase
MANPVQKKHIVLGVTGSIAAYKAADIASKLTQQGALVDVILTESACQFISPLSFQSVTGRKAYVDSDLWGGEGHVTHIGLGHNADLMVIAPISANTMAKLAQGIGDNLLSVTALAAKCPLMIAPAMDAGMYDHTATQANVTILKNRGAVFIGPEEGHLASGMVGLGRMSEPATIISAIRCELGKSGQLQGKKIVVSAGPTREALDPVRFLSNHSSGRQGYAVAQAALDLGASVSLISGPTGLTAPYGVDIIPVTTAAEMTDAVLKESKDAFALIMAAAVADFRPAQKASNKIKKGDNSLTLKLESTIDILKAVAVQKAETGFPQKTIGFAAESQHLLENAQSKLEGKKLDLIIANDITAPGAGFVGTTNQVTLLFADGRQESLPMQEKSTVAEAIIDTLC